MHLSEELTTDVIVIVPPKHGTTWLVHVCHQIRMKGQEPDFENQLDIIGWIEASTKLASKAQEQPATPHLYISHLSYPLVPKGGRKIYSFRRSKRNLYLKKR